MRSPLDHSKKIAAAATALIRFIDENETKSELDISLIPPHLRFNPDPIKGIGNLGKALLNGKIELERFLAFRPVYSIVLHSSIRKLKLFASAPSPSDTSEEIENVILYINYLQELRKKSYALFFQIVRNYRLAQENLKIEEFKQRSVDILKSGLEDIRDEASRLEILRDIFSRVEREVLPSHSNDGSHQFSRSSQEEFNLGKKPSKDRRQQDVNLTLPPNGEKYSSHARSGEDVVDFIKRVYEEPGYLTGEFTRADLRKIDREAMVALDTWEQGDRSRPKGRAPLNLPTRTERNNRLRNADPTTLTHGEKLAQNRLLTVRKYELKKSQKDI